MSLMYYFEDIDHYPVDVEGDLRFSLNALNVMKVLLDYGSNFGFTDFVIERLYMLADESIDLVEGISLGLHYLPVELRSSEAE